MNAQCMSTSTEANLSKPSQINKAKHIHIHKQVNFYAVQTCTRLSTRVGKRTIRETEVSGCGLEVFSREWPCVEVVTECCGRSGGKPDEGRSRFRNCMILMRFSARAASKSALGSS